MPTKRVQIRPATDDDLPGILEVTEATHAWDRGERYAAFYRWKHHENPFGRSPVWVAADGDRVVGLRAYMRWRFTDGSSTWAAARAVDASTHPDYMRQGLFRRLTLHSLEELMDQGVAYIFNTPNEKSRPGYLSMGWVSAGRLPVAARFRSPVAAAKAVRARVPAEKWSLASDAGSPAADALSDDAEVAELIDQNTGIGIRTELSVEWLRWRYGFGPLRYRGIRMREGRGIGLFRLRRRGPAIECVVGHLLASDDEAAQLLQRRIASVTGADQVIQITRRPYLRGGFVPLPGAGPLLTWRGLTDREMPDLARWQLSMGDVELF